jgi:catechol 2,3-dioxygenase-like lactoylglutathione lyase family enzyme
MTHKVYGLIPVLPVADVDATLAYYRDVLGFSVEGRHKDESGEVVFGSALCGGANFYFAKSKPPIAANHCMVYVNEVDELCAAFRTRGGRILAAPADKPWGYRQFTLADLDGHILDYFRFSDGVK